MRAFLTGATGTVGREAVRALVDRGVDVRLGTRDFPPTSIEPSLFEGVDALCLAAPSTEQETSESTKVLTAAIGGGVSHLVHLSSRAAEWDEHAALHRRHREIEAAVRASSASWVVLRPCTLFQSFIRLQAGNVRDMSAIIAPLGEGLIPYVDAVDVGDATAECLLAPTVHHGNTYVLTGGRAYGAKGVAAEIGRVIGKPVTYIDVDEAQAREMMVRGAASTSSIDATLAVFAHAKAGGEAAVDPTLTRLLGRPATTLSEFVERNRDAWT